MSDDNRQALVRFIGGGSERKSDLVIDASAFIDAGRRKQLQERLRDLQAEHNIVDADSDPSEFRHAIAEREAAVAAKPSGHDVPRWQADTPIMKSIYGAHDAITTLPHPGGLGMLILAIVLLFLILIPATGNGETRTLLLWDVLLGRKQIDQASAPQTGDAIGQSYHPPAVTVTAVQPTSTPLLTALASFVDLSVPPELMLGSVGGLY